MRKIKIFAAWVACSKLIQTLHLHIIATTCTFRNLLIINRFIYQYTTYTNILKISINTFQNKLSTVGGRFFFTLYISFVLTFVLMFQQENLRPHLQVRKLPFIILYRANRFTL